MPVMGINKSDLPIRQHLFSKTRGGLLTLLYGNPEGEYYVNQIMQIVRSGSGAVQRELRLMMEAGLLIRIKKGNLVYYRANAECPIFPELKSLAGKGILSSMEISGNRSGSAKQSMKVNPNIKVPGGKIAGFCQRHHVKKLSLFGSVLRNDFGPESDVDVLVEFMPGYTPGYFGLYDMEKELSELLGGRKTDIRTAQDLSRYFRDQVIREASVQYEAAG
jgi:hypothetical protein